MSNYTGRSGYKSTGAASNKSAATTKTGNGDKVRPVYNLSISIEGEEKLVKLTGLFENESKNGAKYYSVNVKEEIVIPANAKLMLFANTPKK